MRATLLAVLVLTTGCSYHQLGTASHLPPGIQTLSVPIFQTKVLAYHTEVAFTQAVIRELNTRTRYVITSRENDEAADARLEGTILSQTIAPLTYDATSGQTSSYLVTIRASVRLVAQDGRVLYRNDDYPWHEQYQSTQDLSSFVQEDGAAVGRMARDFAHAVVSAMLEGMQ